jgi:hypothetical protein
MKESGLRPYNWTGLSYNAWRNVVPKRRLEWLGYETVHLEKKKPNQHWVKMKDGNTNFDTGAAQKSDYSDMIYTADAQCMQSRYQTSRYEKNLAEFSFPDWTPPEVEIPTEELPSAPTGLTATVISTTEIDLSWTAVDDALSYYIYRDGAFLVATSSVTYYDTGLTAATEYSYQVSAINTAGEGEKCSAVAATTATAGTWSDNFNAEAINTDKWLVSDPAPVISDGHLSADNTAIVGVSSYAIWGSSFSISIKVDRKDQAGNVGFLIDSYPYSGGTVSYYIAYWPPWPANVALSTGEWEPVSDTSSTIYLKVERNGSSFTFMHSIDGSSYETLATKTLFEGNVGISLYFDNYNYGPPSTFPPIGAIDSFDIQSGEPVATPKAKAGSLYWGQ